MLRAQLVSFHPSPIWNGVEKDIEPKAILVLLPDEHLARYARLIDGHRSHLAQPPIFARSRPAMIGRIARCGNVNIAVMHFGRTPRQILTVEIDVQLFFAGSFFKAHLRVSLPPLLFSARALSGASRLRGGTEPLLHVLLNP